MGVCRIIPLGGLGEVGKNMTVYEADGSIVVVDAGLAFPRDEHLGVDLVLPDFSYLREREEMVRAVVLTHGHEDHVGSLPYLMREVRVPLVIATRLTLALVKSKLDEHGLLRAAELRELMPGDDPVELGPFRLEFIRMAHSIPDAAAVVARDAGRPLSSTPATTSSTTRPSTGSAPTSAGSRRSATAASTSCSATRRTPSGRASRSPSAWSARRSARSSRAGTGRILVSSFASNVHRMQQAADVGARLRAQGRVRRPLDAEEREHRAQPRLHGRARGRDHAAAGARRAAARPAADPLHRQPGRADVGDDADRLQRPSRRAGSSAATR